MAEICEAKNCLVVLLGGRHWSASRAPLYDGAGAIGQTNQEEAGMSCHRRPMQEQCVGAKDAEFRESMGIAGNLLSEAQATGTLRITAQVHASRCMGF